MDEFELVAALRALGAQTRWRVMRLLADSETGMAAGDIARILHVRQNTLSSHIAALTRCGLIDGRRQGRNIVYTADSRKVRKFAARILVILGNTPESAIAKILQK
jgi:DNA-binding transcriptional ArsR family regulator